MKLTQIRTLRPLRFRHQHVGRPSRFRRVSAWLRKPVARPPSRGYVLAWAAVIAGMPWMAVLLAGHPLVTRIVNYVLIAAIAYLVLRIGWLVWRVWRKGRR